MANRDTDLPALPLSLAINAEDGVNTANHVQQASLGATNDDLVSGDLHSMLKRLDINTRCSTLTSGTLRARSWSSSVSYTIKLTRYTDEPPYSTHGNGLIFDAENSSWGRDCFIDFDDLMNPCNDYVKEDAINMEIDFTFCSVITARRVSQVRVSTSTNSGPQIDSKTNPCTPTHQSYQ
ncbi:hypothetical protein PRIPAC_80005 [Pristionchus pacificus]|uniref:Uncharacterized protein n=1 Tax=Pristionchus pacificus TaxID=54126 RepID=A0A2A6CLW8_PRIPA|nr:hypothetical protein PRIPAC_80005 [Pristionchus pacificus]|eukprot:PDM79235.1 hypothetical protein PRIPAC_31814 [Pristionchus pacificus]